MTVALPVPSLHVMGFLRVFGVLLSATGDKPPGSRAYCSIPGEKSAVGTRYNAQLSDKKSRVSP